jgi:hypothetical protein
LEKFAVVIASSPNSPNSKLQTSLPRLDIFNSEQHSFYCYHSFAGGQANLSVFFPLRRKLSLFFFQKKSRIPEYLRGTIDLASCNLGLYCLTLHRAAATRTAPLATSTPHIVQYPQSLFSQYRFYGFETLSRKVISWDVH